MTGSKISQDEHYVRMLGSIASRSTCPRRSVAAIVVDVRGRVLSTGYNGVPSGYPHCTEFPCPGVEDSSGDTSSCMAVHAEQNALLQLEGNFERAYKIYCSALPCLTCAKLICNTPIQKVIYVDDYADHRGLTLFIELQLLALKWPA